MTQQYIRSCTLIVEGSSVVFTVSNLRVVFRTRQANLQTPAHADIRIYNLSAETANMVQKEFTKVTLSAGYVGNESIIFKGEIIQVRKGRENPVDTFVHILATTADQAYNFAVVNKTLAAGHTFRDQVDVALEAMKPYGVTAGYIADLGSTKMPRGRTMFGMARDLLRTVAFSTASSWSIQNNKLQIVKNTETMPGQAIVLNSRTGMIGLPTQSIDGIEVRCLLNPEIVPGKRLQINQSSIQQAALSPGYTAAVTNSMIPTLADDGFYKVLVVEHHGDTRGGPWYTDSICIRADGTSIPISLASQGINVIPEDR